MRLNDCIEKVSTFVDLKRIANPYVIDFRKLGFEELKGAMLTTSPQYDNENNIVKMLSKISVCENQTIRTIAPVFIKEILLNKDDFMELQRVVDDEILVYEKKMIDFANEVKETSLSKNLLIYKAVLEAAWEKDDNITSDEQNLINRIKNKLSINDDEAILVETKLGKYPTIGNNLHTKEEVDSVRRYLQSCGLLFCVRDSDGRDFDVIPEEIALVLRRIFKVDIRRHAYDLLLSSKYVRSKTYLLEILSKAGVEINQYMTVGDLQLLCKKHLLASQVIGGFSPLDGIDKTTLEEWASKVYGKKVYGTKKELIDKIVSHYDGIKQLPEVVEDVRENLFNYYVELASRDLKVLREQVIIDKDIDTERKFEQATNYLFEILLKNKPLLLAGTEHPDGMLSFNNKLIMWDNKSKETPVHLSDHIKQFDRYIKSSEKEVAVFMVIAPSFSEDSITEAAKYSLMNDTMILLITAEELKDVAIEWNKKHPNEIFPLAYFKQNGRFNRKLVLI